MSLTPKNFFLNEQHVLSPAEKTGGGRTPKYAEIPWASRARRLSSSLSRTIKRIAESNDPLKDRHFFALTKPVERIVKLSTNKRKAPDGRVEERPDFSGTHARVLDRIGLELLQVTNDGAAVVHAPSEMLNQLQSRTASLERLGEREQSRWVAIDSFHAIPTSIKLDKDWVASLVRRELADVIIELHPVLSRIEVDTVFGSVAQLIVSEKGEKLTGSGQDFSGRYWCRARIMQQSLMSIAEQFHAVQAIHSPHFSIAAAKQVKRMRPDAPRSPKSNAQLRDLRELPCVAVVDLGVPSNHRQLAEYCVDQITSGQGPIPPVGDHGSFVASRIVFGDQSSADALSEAIGECSFYDVVVADFPDAQHRNKVEDKVVVPTMQNVHRSAPDVRVFNLSFGDVLPFVRFSAVDAEQKLRLVEDLDNFVNVADKVVVIAAGNSIDGLRPRDPYPQHYDDPQWGLGPWALGHNTIVCGSCVPGIGASGLGRPGWPSPFTRVGPGLSSSPVPTYCAPGGNSNLTFGWGSGLGVWGYSGSGLVEDRCGTSFAVPIVAREAALAVRELSNVCAAGTEPFAVCVRAFLTLTAVRHQLSDGVAALADRTLGFGNVSHGRLRRPTAGSAVFVWQGYVESSKDIVRIQIPVPRDWLEAADEPVLRFVFCADPPVNSAARSTWTCRRFKPVLHPGLDSDGLRARSGGHPDYPVISKTYKLGRYKPGQEKAVDSDVWLLDVSYDDTVPYPVGLNFDPRQRVAFAAELIDQSRRNVDPQPAVQGLKIAASMVRLSILPTALRSPVMLRNRT